MSPTLRRLCPGCKVALVTRGRCPACERAREAPRGTTTERGLGWRYQQKRARILARDRGICWICGLPAATTIDHVIPRARGGSSDDDNLRAAHGRCNSGRRG
jgi:5-methylcytosine-specific restriction protein A